MVIIAIICIVFVSKTKDFIPAVFITGFRFCMRNEVYSNLLRGETKFHL